MTQEEKAKAYDEALARCRWQLANKCITEESATDLFRELAESEDERIRKSIIRLLQVGGYMPLEDKEKAFAWLEKLKELTAQIVPGYTGHYFYDGVKLHLLSTPAIEEKQKEQNGKNEVDNDFTIYHPLKNGKGKYECIPYSFYGSLTSFSKDKDLIDFLHNCFYTKEECNEWIEQQKEQNPLSTEETELNSTAFLEQMGYTCIPPGKEQKSAEWSEEDKSIYASIMCEVVKEGMCLTPVQANWIKLLPEKFSPQPKQEWSEEDEIMIDKICHAILVSTYHRKGLTLSEMNQCQAWMHNLSQKEVPSNERDRWLISRALEHVSMSNEDDEFKKEIEACLKRRQPQPHWKPSEEQMEALFLVSGVGAPKHRKMLESLYNDLKKL